MFYGMWLPHVWHFTHGQAWVLPHEVFLLSKMICWKLFACGWRWWILDFTIQNQIRLLRLEESCSSSHILNLVYEMKSWTLETISVNFFLPQWLFSFYDWNTKSYRTLELGTTLVLQSYSLEFQSVMIILEKSQSL